MKMENSMKIDQLVYSVIGCMHEVYRQLGPGLPEYVYQEALMSELTANGITAYKELAYHPLYKGEPLNTYIKMDMVAECPEGRVIVECKAPNVTLSQSVLEQALRYHSVLQPKFLLLTNGVAIHCFKADNAQLTAMDRLPDYNEMTA